MTDEHSHLTDWNDATRTSCEFAFKCPKMWDRLTPTDNPMIRHCSECDRDVHLVLKEEDFRRHAESGHCVAVPVKAEESFASYLGNIIPPYGSSENETERPSR